jgi:outer membrane lipoprotein-sorting protein
MKYLIFLLLTASSSMSAFAGNFTLPELMQTLGQRTSLQANFNETKIDSYLEIPISYSGQVEYKAPDYLKKITRKPFSQSFTLDRNQVTIAIKQQPAKTYSMDEHPQLKAFAASFLSILSGDLDRLQKYYASTITGDEKNWTITLKPLDSEISKYIEFMQFSGKQSDLIEVTTWYQSGDKSKMEFIEPSTLIDYNQKNNFD